ncbi:hypothetical protein HYH03_018164 [Edaphochlamys debaryana]|uniref:Uncharacterized protein n=1 Tax=Edaphochlamys debaryana TaxID=47281 RepID=A0A835XGG8_9CHLO|nr:hypothetical protein HYH03_018164 [Edaphochlamys debaryana]|eukprot:KAG2482939.1 hypothetical protein HYH03_018164 [Edaphochlamys debaryana]
MLARFPLRPHAPLCWSDPRAASRAGGPPPAGARCALCNKGAGEVRLMHTPCCAQVVCDNAEEYQLMSYSREFCSRSHERYTLCGYHGLERHCDRGPDWRHCPACAGRDGRPGRDEADRVWRGLNPYNYCPLLEADAPRHALCATCDACKGKFIPGAEGSVRGPRGLRCLPCAGP